MLSSSEASEISVEIPRNLLCPITLKIFLQPVVVSDGHTYEKEAITYWFKGKASAKSPMTGELLTDLSLRPNHDKKSQVCEFVEKNPDAQTKVYRLEAQSSELAKGVSAQGSAAGNGQPQSLIFSHPPSAPPQATVDLNVGNPVTSFLTLVASGNQGHAEEMLRQDSSLALAHGTIRDLSGRTFENITALQYAAWALDRHMWTMIANYLSPEQVTEQLREAASWTNTHGVHAGMPGGPLDTLITTYKKYLADYIDPSKSGADLCNDWRRQVGTAQFQVPAHVAQEFCEPNRALYPFPNFESATLSRIKNITTRQTTDAVNDNGEWLQTNGHDLTGDWFSAKHRGNRTLTGGNFGIIRCSNALPSAYEGPTEYQYDPTTFRTKGREYQAVLWNSDALGKLVEVRAREWLQLHTSLGVTVTARPNTNDHTNPRRTTRNRTGCAPS